MNADISYIMSCSDDEFERVTGIRLPEDAWERWSADMENRKGHLLALFAEVSKPAQYFDEVMYDGNSTAEALKRFQENVRPTSLPNAFEQLIREADKPTQVPEQLAKYAAALVAGTHEITSLTIRPKRIWVRLTNNELQPIADEYRILFGSWVEDFARAIEAKLKEKNHV